MNVAVVRIQSYFYNFFYLFISYTVSGKSFAAATATGSTFVINLFI